MEFDKTEAIFYGIIGAAGSIGGLIRLWRDNERLDIRGSLGRILSSGILAFGAIGCWIGRAPSDTITGPVFYVAVATLIGYMGKELQDKILAKLVTYALKRAGLIDEAKEPD
ncbi:hypothetical protein [Aureliella helgolandensis]|uniref:Holin n=1 Tax=Aureliella helgolandensis TaxID=2527968 RepID=A0A518GCR4_9BACT|nr:hypothetical protein [Aureliella helgolandensis]QDV26350.1 hypothetical protein Q31a_47230 [Aureliella helgolandensis]